MTRRGKKKAGAYPSRGAAWRAVRAALRETLALRAEVAVLSVDHPRRKQAARALDAIASKWRKLSAKRGRAKRQRRTPATLGAVARRLAAPVPAVRSDRVVPKRRLAPNTIWS